VPLLGIDCEAIRMLRPFFDKYLYIRSIRIALLDAAGADVQKIK
jgi:hypothetical protein